MRPQPLADSATKLLGDQSYDGAGSAVAPLDDPSGDWSGHFLIGAPHYELGGERTGRIYQVHSLEEGLPPLADADARFFTCDDSLCGCGGAVAMVEDLDGDLLPDILVIGVVINQALTPSSLGLVGPENSCPRPCVPAACRGPDRRYHRGHFAVILASRVGGEMIEVGPSGHEAVTEPAGRSGGDRGRGAG